MSIEEKYKRVVELTASIEIRDAALDLAEEAHQAGCDTCWRGAPVGAVCKRREELQALRRKVRS